MRPLEQHRRVLELVGAGLNDCEIARLLGIPRRTVLDWRHGRRKSVTPPSRCDGAHDFSQWMTPAYAYLLGAYLGDGYISKSKRSFVLRVTLDRRYPRVITEVADAMLAVWPQGRVSYVHRPGGGCVEVMMRSRHWPCLFPQHGPGRKHERPIRLRMWQERVVRAYTKPFLRGLIHSDGCRFVARNRSGAKVREYVRYSFSNRSEDIKRLFCEACDVLGIGWTRAGHREIAVARRADVHRLESFIGQKQ
jgi:hypothetical protein